MAVKTTQQLKEEFAAGSLITAAKLENLIDSVPVVRTHIETTNNTLDLTNPQNEYYNFPVGSVLLIVNKLNNAEPAENNNLTVIVGQNPVQEGEDPDPITVVINQESSISLVKVVVGSDNNNLIWSPTVSSTIQWEYLS
jgi:hypothetical protein